MILKKLSDWKTLLLFKLPVTQDWLFYVFVGFYALNIYTVIPTYNRVLGNTSGYMVVFEDWNFLKLLILSYLFGLPVLVLRGIYWKFANKEKQVCFQNRVITSSYAYEKIGFLLFLNHLLYGSIRLLCYLNWEHQGLTCTRSWQIVQDRESIKIQLFNESPKLRAFFRFCFGDFLVHYMNCK